MTGSTLQIDQQALFAACNHDTRLTGIVLALLEVATGEKVTVGFAHANTDAHVRHYRDQVLQAVGLPT